ncbi:hypothetical protein [Streptomyces iakyrus]
MNARVVEVSAESAGGLHYGTGFAVSARLVLTARHVVADADRISVRALGDHAVAWVPDLPGYALLVLAAVPAWQMQGGLSYLVAYGRPEEVFLHDGRISYRVRQGSYAQRPEAWPS